MSAHEGLNLHEIASGALQDIFDFNFEKVIDNINDINTDAGKARKITIELKFTPDKEDREIIDLDINAKPTLIPLKGFSTKLFVELDSGTRKITATEYKKQMKGQLEIEVDNVAPASEDTTNNVVAFKAR